MKMDGQNVIQRKGWMYRWPDGLVVKQMFGCVDEWMVQQMNRLDEWQKLQDEFMTVWVDIRTD